MNRTELLAAELKAINLWDEMLADDPNPPQIDKDAAKVRFFRRLEIVNELMKPATNEVIQ